MALDMTYRSNRFVKNYVAKYLTSIFLANEKGALTFSDGSKNITFSQTPYVGRAMQWEPQHLPAVLIGKATTTLHPLSFTKDGLYEARASDADQYRYVGGDITVALELLVRARSEPERENLADIVSIYLSHPAAKDFLLAQNIVIEKNPTVSGESTLPAPSGLDYPIYIASMSLTLRSQWVEQEALTDPRLIDIISDITD